MREYIETLRNLKNAVDRCESSSFFGKVSESAAYEDAKALLARPEPHNDPTWECVNCDAIDEFSVRNEVEQGRPTRLIECHACGLVCRREIEPAAAEKARERNIAMTVCHAITDNCVMVDDPERPECTADNCAAMKALKGCSEVKPSPPAATGETK